MAGLSIRDRVALLALAVDRSWRAPLGALGGLPLLRRRRLSPLSDHLLFLPQDLRSTDPSFAEELADGMLGLAGQVVNVAGRSPFALPPPSIGWERELHGFGWLRDLEAAQTDDAKSLARRIARDWIHRHRRRNGVAWEPAVTARRIISWLAHASLLIDDADDKSFAELSTSLGEQIAHLAARWRQAPDGLARLLPLIALLLCDLCVEGRDATLPRRERALARELERQILPDGGHVSRSPHVLIELMLDLLPVRQCFAARRRSLPEALERAVVRMVGMLHLLRHRDGSLARFNGMGLTPADAMATILAYAETEPAPTRLARSSSYARIAAGGTTVIADVGAPPPLLHAGAAHAGCLSFELCSDAHALIVNCGAVPPSDATWHTASRSTSNHSTLCLRERSSSVLVRTEPVLRELGAAALRSPATVVAELVVRDGVAELSASHDGYLAEFGLVHQRRLTLSADGERLDGEDTLGPRRGELRLSHDLPFAVHFHLGPTVSPRSTQTPGAAELDIAGARGWHFSVEGAALSIEEGLDFASHAGPRPAMQLVLRGRCAGSSRVTWRVVRRA